MYLLRGRRREMKREDGCFMARVEVGLFTVKCGRAAIASSCLLVTAAVTAGTPCVLLGVDKSGFLKFREGTQVTTGSVLKVSLAPFLLDMKAVAFTSSPELP
jgi:hypothetical protein